MQPAEELAGSEEAPPGKARQPAEARPGHLRRCREGETRRTATMPKRATVHPPPFIFCRAVIRVAHVGCLLTAALQAALWRSLEGGKTFQQARRGPNPTVASDSLKQHLVVQSVPKFHYLPKGFAGHSMTLKETLAMIAGRDILQVRACKGGGCGAICRGFWLQQRLHARYRERLAGTWEGRFHNCISFGACEHAWSADRSVPAAGPVGSDIKSRMLTAFSFVSIICWNNVSTYMQILSNGHYCQVGP